MNRIYKLVWSKSRNMFVAVNEFAKTKSKFGGSNVVGFGKSCIFDKVWLLAY